MYTHVHLEKAFTSCEEAKDDSLSHVDGPEIQRATAFTQMGVRVVSILRGEGGGREGGRREGGEGGGGREGGREGRGDNRLNILSNLDRRNGTSR